MNTNVLMYKNKIFVIGGYKYVIANYKSVYAY